jgi:hypothetical protein
MKVYCLIVAMLLLPCSLAANVRFTEEQVVKYAKGLDVAKLDPALSPQRLDQWLQSGPAHLDTITWEMSDCDLKGPAVAPLCVKVRFQRGSVGGWAIVRIGTFRDGISGQPRLDHLLVGSKKGILPDSNKLSELPRLLDKEASLLKEAP